MNHLDSPIIAGLCVGIDVAKEQLDLGRTDSETVLTSANDEPAIDAIVRQLQAERPSIIVVESTGGLERPLLAALLEAELPVALVHPGRVRYFAKGLGILGKTDKIDAKVLARFGKLAAPRLAEKRSKNEEELAALVGCRRQLSVSRVQHQNRLSSTSSKLARRSLEAMIKESTRQIDKLDKLIEELIDADDDFKQLNEQLRSVPGVGPTVSATLLGEMREMGQIDGGQIASLVGVAPFNHDSGKLAGKRSIRGGRTAVRCALYMATVSAIRCNPVIKAFSQRLEKAGKIFKVRVVACMRKLATLINAMLRDGLKWNELDVVKNIVPKG